MSKWMSSIKRGEHLVQFCTSPGQKESAIADLVAGAGEREKIVLFSDSDKLASTVKKKMKKAPKDNCSFDSLPAKGMIYLDSGINPAETLETIRGAIEAQRGAGQTSLILVVDMSWLEQRPELFRPFMQVEVSLNLTKFRFPVTLMCQYDVSSLSDEQMETINSVHAVSMTEGKVARNFWLIPRRGGTFEDMGLVPEESH